MYMYKKETPIHKKKENGGSRRSDNTGIPGHMKMYVENLSGMSLDDVRVHYNSDRPKQFKALGYTEGRNVYLRSGQEKHLMHELCHVVQQKRGIVKPTALEGGCRINDSVQLENEADQLEQRYNNTSPVQMLRDEAAKGSSTMGKTGLTGDAVYRFHVVGFYKLEGYGSDVIWSNHEYWMGKGDGDHAEDAVCDLIEEIGSVSEEFLRGKKLTLWLSSSPCGRCQERLNDLIDDYGVNVEVFCAKSYGGKKGGGAGDADAAKYSMKILEGKESDDLLQF